MYFHRFSKVFLHFSFTLCLLITTGAAGCNNNYDIDSAQEEVEKQKELVTKTPAVEKTAANTADITTTVGQAPNDKFPVSSPTSLAISIGTPVAQSLLKVRNDSGSPAPSPTSTSTSSSILREASVAQSPAEKRNDENSLELQRLTSPAIPIVGTVSPEAQPLVQQRSGGSDKNKVLVEKIEEAISSQERKRQRAINQVVGNDAKLHTFIKDAVRCAALCTRDIGKQESHIAVGIPNPLEEERKESETLKENLEKWLQNLEKIQGKMISRKEQDKKSLFSSCEEIKTRINDHTPSTDIVERKEQIKKQIEDAIAHTEAYKTTATNIKAISFELTEEHTPGEVTEGDSGNSGEGDSRLSILPLNLNRGALPELEELEELIAALLAAKVTAKIKTINEAISSKTTKKNERKKRTNIPLNKLDVIPEEEEEKKEEDHTPTEPISSTPTRGANVNAATNNGDAPSLEEDPHSPMVKIQAWFIQRVREINQSGDDQSIGSVESVKDYLTKQMKEIQNILSENSLHTRDDQSVASMSSVGKCLKDAAEKLGHFFCGLTPRDREHLIEHYRSLQKEAESDEKFDASREIAAMLLKISEDKTLAEELFQSKTQNPSNGSERLEQGEKKEENTDLSQTSVTGVSDSALPIIAGGEENEHINSKNVHRTNVGQENVPKGQFLGRHVRKLREIFQGLRASKT